MAEADATLDPEIAAKNTQANMTVRAKPPLTKRTRLPIKSTKTKTILPLIMMLPININMGTAING